MRLVNPTSFHNPILINLWIVLKLCIFCFSFVIINVVCKYSIHHWSFWKYCCRPGGILLYLKLSLIERLSSLRLFSSCYDIYEPQHLFTNYMRNHPKFMIQSSIFDLIFMFKFSMSPTLSISISFTCKLHNEQQGHIFHTFQCISIFNAYVYANSILWKISVIILASICIHDCY